MKQAAAYIRISDKDQSNFSLEGQEKYIRDYADKNQISIKEVFVDNGKSAKNFDRPNWKLLEDFITKHKNQINYLIVVKYDRFSRNAAEGLQKIELLERKFRIIIVSVFEQMFIDYDSPFFFKQRADILVNAEFELHVIRDRTKFGINQALNSGRYINAAPFGYKNERDEKNKPIIVKVEEKALVIRKIFEDYLNMVPIKQVYRNARERGLTNRGNSCIPDILSNPVYGGLINVPAYRKDPAKIVKGIHEGIVSEAMWWECQRRLGNIKNRTTLNESVPFRGVLLDEKGKPLTAGESRGRRQKYWYYKSVHTGFNMSAIKLHGQFDEVLKCMSIDEADINDIVADTEQKVSEGLKEKERTIQGLRRQIDKESESLHKLEEKFITEQINSETYNKWFKIYKENIGALKASLEREQGNTEEKWLMVKGEIHKLSNLYHAYHAFDLQGKQLFIRQVFNSTLSYFDGSYRTAYLINLLRHNEMKLNEKGLLYIEQPLSKNIEISRCAPWRTSVEHIAFFELISKVS